MSHLLPLDFALTGFRLVRARPQIVAYWGAVSVFGNILALTVLVAMAGSPLAEIIAAMKAPRPDLMQLSRLMEGAMPAVAAMAAINGVVGAILTSAACRAVLSEADDRLGYVRFGFAEVRIFAVNLAMSALNMVVITLVGGFAALAGDAGQVVGLFAALGFIVWLQLRLSLNCAQTFDTGRLDLFGSFALTRSHLPRLVFGYLIALFLAIIVAFLCLQVIGTIELLAFGSKVGMDTTSLKAFFSPAVIINLCLSYGIMTPLTSAIWFGASASAYMHLRRG